MTKRYVISVSLNEEEYRMFNAVKNNLSKEYPLNFNVSNSNVMKMILSLYYSDNENSINKSINKI